MTTARDYARAAHNRFLATILELDLDYCANTYGASPCTAGRQDTGTAQAGASNSITLRAGASAVTDAYNNMTVRLTGGTGAGQERKVSAYNGTTKIATVTVAWTTNPDPTSTYDVINRPGACYNTLTTCQAKDVYVQSTKTYKFCGRGMAIPVGQLIRPYISELSIAPTEIDPKGGLARSSKTEIRLVDEPDGDTEADKYVADRAADAQSTFWARFMARNSFYFGRFARVRHGYILPQEDYVEPDYVVTVYVLPGTGLPVLNENTLLDELYIIDSIKGPTQSGDVTITLKDPIKLADRTTVPAPTDGKLTGNITSTGLSLTVTSGKGSQYGSSGYVRVGDEIINFTSRATDTLSWGSTSNRAQFGTTAAAHNTNDAVQLCKVYSSQLLTDVLIDLLTSSSVATAKIDTAQFALEDSRWLGDKYRITACLSETESPSTYISELCKESNGMLWWAPVDQQFKFKANMPDTPTSTPTALNETSNFIHKSVSVEMLEAERITYASVRYRLLSATANRGEDKNYLEGAITIDANAESAQEYGDRRTDVIRSRFLGSANQVAALALSARMVSWRRDTPVKIKFSLDPKDYTVKVGDLIDINTSRYVDASGANSTIRVRVVKLVDQENQVDIDTRLTKFANRYGFIAPNGTADYPTDTVYAHICRSTPSQTMTNGDSPYLII